MKKLMMALLAVALCIAGAMAEDAPQYLIEGDYAYYLTEGGAVLDSCIAREPLPAEIVLPTEIGGRPITAYDFVYHTSRTDGPVRVIVPEGVTDFGNAFGETGIFSEIVLPASLTHIEEGSLYWGDAEITVHPDNPYFTCEDGFLIDQRTGTLLYTAPAAADMPLPAVKRLGDFCLYNWHAGETILLPETLTAIGIGVFDDLVDLTHIDIPDGVTEIGGGAFNCTGLTEITLPAGLTAIEALTFSCNEFTEITIPEGVEYIDSWAFYMCPLTRVEIPASCTFVAADAFDPEVELVLLGDNTHVETERELDARERGAEHVEGNCGYTLTDEGAVITDYFWDEVVPEEIGVPDTLGGQPVIGVADSAFYAPIPDVQWPPEGACIRLPEGMQFLESGAFYSIWNVRQVQLPASLERIGESAFWYFGGDIVVAEGNPHFTCEDGFLIDTRTGTLLYAAASAPDGAIPAVRRIGSRALDNRQLPADLILPEGVEELAGGAFYDTQVRSVTLPESLRVIETSAFECVSVTSGRIVVPAGVEVVEYGAFGLTSPMAAEIVILGENTRVETAEEYFRRTGEVWVLEDGWEIEYTRAAPSPEENAVCIEGSWEYAVTEEGAVITGFLWGDGASNEIVVPGTLGGLPVVGVDAFAFSTMDVKLDANIACITLPEGLRFLDAEAFRCAHDVAAVYLPASLSEIPEGAFFHFEGEITVDGANPHFVCENGFLIDTRSGTLLYAAPSSVGQALPAVRRYGAYALFAWGEDFDQPLLIPEGVEVIGQHAVYDFCYASVTLPASLKTLETLAFQSIFVDAPIVIPASVELIEYGAFGLDGQGAEVIVMSPATHIETAEEYAQRTGEIWVLEDGWEIAYTQWFAPTLAEDAVPHTESEWAYILTGEGAVLTDWDWDFNEEHVPDVVELPATLGGMPVVGVGYNALNTYTMPGKYRFTLVIPEGVRWLEAGALQCCHNAEALVLPASLVSIPEGFSSHLFARITLSQGNPRYILQDGYLIDTQTDTLIYTCPNAAWEIPSVRRIGNNALDNHSLGDALDESLWAQGVHLTIPEGVEVLGGWNFYDSLIDSVTLPESLRVIETNAFEAVEITCGVVVPASVELIQYGAFGLYGTDLEVIVMSPSTHIETAEEYAQRTGEALEDVLAYTCELEYTPGWE